MQPYTVPCDTPIVGARSFVDRGKAAQQRRQLLTDRGSRFGGTDRCGHDRLVDGRHARKQCPRTRWNQVETPPLRFLPAAIFHERDLLQTICDVNPEAPAQKSEQLERARRFVREGSVQHQHGAVIGEPPDVARQRFHRRRMHFQCMIGRIARNHRAVHAARDRRIDSKTEASIYLGERPAGVVQIGKMRNA